MPEKEYVDRGSFLEGVEKTARDARVPYNFPRKIENFSLPDKRAKRRVGFQTHLTTGEQGLAKVTGAVTDERQSSLPGFRHDIFKTPLSYGLLRHASVFQPTTASDWTVFFRLVVGENEELVQTPFKRRVSIQKEFAITGHTVGNPHQITIGAGHGIPASSSLFYIARCKSVTGSAASLLNGTTITVTWISSTVVRVNGINTTALTASGGTIVIAFSTEQTRKEGVYVYDQTVLANALTLNKGTIAAPTDDFSLLLADTAQHDSYPVTALAIGYNKDEIFMEMDLVEDSGGDAGRYWNRAVSLAQTMSGFSNWGTPGSAFEIYVRFDASAGAGGFGQINFRIDDLSGITSETTFDIPAVKYVFPGQYDKLNEQVLTIERDIVLLNECTARGSYSSTCRTRKEMHGNQTFFHAYSNTPDDISVPWCLSPPRGTRLHKLRIWSKYFLDNEVQAWIDDNFEYGDPTSVASLEGYWDLDDGVGICLDTTGNERHITVHHGLPAYVTHDELLHDRGLSIADGQHVIFSFGENDDLFVNDAFGMLKNTFEHDTRGEDVGGASSTFLNYQARHNYTAMIQIRTPYRWQQELNKVNSGVALADTNGNESGRESMNLGPYAIHDGLTVNQGQRVVRNELDTVDQYFRAYDQTLFTLEGVATNPTSPAAMNKSNAGVTYRIPIFKCSLTPEGFIAYEAYKAQGDNTIALQSRLYRVVTDTALDFNETYSIAVRQKVTYNWNFFDKVHETDGFQLAIWFQKLSDSATPISATPDESYLEVRLDTAAHKCRTTSIEHIARYDIIIGASMVNSGWDHSISAPIVLTRATGNGPWVVPQHFMSPYQDQPGFFILGMFRLWTAALSRGEIQKYLHTSISKEEYVPQLVVNLEMEEITGAQQINKCRYPYLFDLGYKGWGIPQGHKLEVINASTFPHVKRELYPGAWSYEDGLGYMVTNELYKDKPKHINCLAPYQNTLKQSFGLIVGVGESMIFDPDVDGDLTKIFQLGVQSHGLLNDFVRDEKWRGTVIGDRTILTSRGGSPKVFDGRHLLVAGFKRWSGGQFTVRQGAGALAQSKWYGIRVVYFSEENTLEHISPVHVIELPAGAGGIDVLNIPPHYDPRITSIRFYRTTAQSSQDLAEAGAMFPEPLGNKPNLFLDRFVYSTKDADLLAAPLNLNQTRMPTVAFSAALNGKLYLTGDILEPDAVYITDAGNPERIDVIDNKLVLEEGTGDRTNGIVAEFGSIFVFKANSTWRIDDLGGNQYQVIRLAGIGAVSADSIQVITMPDSGRTVIAFWSTHGPHLFDGSTFQYIGTPIEEQDQIGEDASEYAWMDAESVMTAHDVKRREIIFFHKPKKFVASARTTLSRRSEAVVYNYRFNSWYLYTNLLGRVALSISFTGADISGNVSTLVGHAALGYTNEFNIFIGGDNGVVYKWAKTDVDGEDIPNSVIYSEALVTTWDGSSGLLKTDGTPTRLAQDLWVTVVQQDTFDHFSLPIKKPSDTTIFDGVMLDLNYNASPIQFTPVAGDTVYFLLPPCLIEFPWDELGIPFFDKQLMELITWHNKAFHFRTTKNYGGTPSAWTLLTDSASKRKKTTLKLKLEALKLELLSFKKECELDSYAYRLAVTKGSNRKQT